MDMTEIDGHVNQKSHLPLAIHSAIRINTTLKFILNLCVNHLMIILFLLQNYFKHICFRSLMRLIDTFNIKLFIIKIYSKEQ